MKRLFKMAVICFGNLISVSAGSAEIIDERSVYSPALNVSVSSFGGLIGSSEILILPGAKTRMIHARQLLVRWIHENNYEGFYLKEFDSSQFYWQFVETRKYIGAILLIPGDEIQADFYLSLGGGLSIHGKNFYGLTAPENLNGDVFSFVVNKETIELNHFENWKFTTDQEMSFYSLPMPNRKLLSQKEWSSIHGVAVREISGMDDQPKVLSSTLSPKVEKRKEKIFPIVFKRRYELKFKGV